MRMLSSTNNSMQFNGRSDDEIIVINTDGNGLVNLGQSTTLPSMTMPLPSQMETSILGQDALNEKIDMILDHLLGAESNKNKPEISTDHLYDIIAKQSQEIKRLRAILEEHGIDL